MPHRNVSHFVVQGSVVLAGVEGQPQGMVIASSRSQIPDGRWLVVHTLLVPGHEVADG